MAPKQSKSRQKKRKVLLIPRQSREISSNLVTFEIEKFFFLNLGFNMSNFIKTL